MNKSEFIEAIATSANLSKADAARAVDAVIGVITDTLNKGDAVNITGFGSFVVRDRAARTGLNPRTKEAIEIAASRAPAFKPGKTLKDAVN